MLSRAMNSATNLLIFIDLLSLMSYNLALLTDSARVNCLEEVEVAQAAEAALFILAAFISPLTFCNFSKLADVVVVSDQ